MLIECFRDGAATIIAKARPWLLPQPRNMICYFFHKPGHMRQDCPQRQGSQGIGMTQS